MRYLSPSTLAMRKEEGLNHVKIEHNQSTKNVLKNEETTYLVDRSV